jgi:hypothetical protein
VSPRLTRAVADGDIMTAYNVVRFRVKPGREQDFIDAHRSANPSMPGFKQGALIKTGDHTFCVVAEWQNFQRLAAARPTMIALLDSMRDMLEDLGNDLGVTDPVSGDVVVALKPRKRRAAKRARPKAKAKAPARTARRAKRT